jgi:acyl carrier protein
MSNLRQDIRQFVVETFLFGQENGFSDDASFLEEGIVDSTGVLELVTHLTVTYGIEVSDHELLPENLDSVNAVVAYLRKKLPAPIRSS